MFTKVFFKEIRRKKVRDERERFGRKYLDENFKSRFNHFIQNGVKNQIREHAKAVFLVVSDPSMNEL